MGVSFWYTYKVFSGFFPNFFFLRKKLCGKIGRLKVPAKNSKLGSIPGTLYIEKRKRIFDYLTLK